jgi:hypothetical protein
LTASEASGTFRVLKAEPCVAAGGAGTMAFQVPWSLQPAPLLNVVVRRQETLFGGNCMLPRILAVLATLGALWLASPSVAQEKTDKLDEQAKAVAEKFTRAFVVDMKVDDVMKLVAVPYIYFSADPKEEKKPQVLNKADDVRKQFLAAMEAKKPLTGKLTFKEVIAYEKLATEEKPPEKLRKALDEVLKKTDRIVKVRLGEKEDGSFAEVITLVSWRDGQPKVVGYRLGFAGPKKK